MMLMMTKRYDYDDDIDDESDHEHDSYTAAGAAPGTLSETSYEVYEEHRYKLDTQN